MFKNSKSTSFFHHYVNDLSFCIWDPVDTMTNCSTIQLIVELMLVLWSQNSFLALLLLIILHCSLPFGNVTQHKFCIQSIIGVFCYVCIFTLCTQNRIEIVLHCANLKLSTLNLKTDNNENWNKTHSDSDVKRT